MKVLSAIKQYAFDGLLFGLHGAMDLDFCEDGEGEFLSRVRNVVGEKNPIAITLVTNACFGPMVDGAAAQALHTADIGARVHIALGGKTDPSFGGGPLAVDGELVSISDGHFTGDGSMIHGLGGSFDPNAVLRVNDIEILVVTIARQLLDLQQFKAFDTDSQNKRVVALKSMQHFRAAFEPIAGQVIVCGSGSLCTPRYNRLPYRNVPRPIFPLDQI